MTKKVYNVLAQVKELDGEVRTINLIGRPITPLDLNNAKMFDSLDNKYPDLWRALATCRESQDWALYDTLMTQLICEFISRVIEE